MSSSLKDNFNLTMVYALVVTVALLFAVWCIYLNNPTDLQSQLKEKDQEISTLINKNKGFQSIITKLEADFLKTQERIQQLEGEATSKETLRETLSKEIEWLTKEVVSKDNTITKLNNEIKNLNQTIKKYDENEYQPSPNPINPEIESLKNENLQLQRDLEVAKKNASDKITELTQTIENLNGAVRNLNSEIKNKNDEIQKLKDSNYLEQAKLLEDIAKRRELLNRCKDAYYLYIIRLTQKVAIEKFPEDYNNGEADKYKKKNGIPLNDTLDGPEQFPKLSSSKLGLNIKELQEEKSNIEKDLDSCIKSYKKYADWMFWYTNENDKKTPRALGCKTPEDFEKDFHKLKSN